MYVAILACVAAEISVAASKVSANRYCVGKGTGTAKDPAFTFTLSDPASVTLTGSCVS